MAQHVRQSAVGCLLAEYVLLRGLGRTHIFPGDDLGARNNLERLLGLTNSGQPG
jgi:DNA-3-methyladenine glycosylase II